MPFAAFDISPMPFKTDRTLRAVPYVTYALCYINIFVYLAHVTDSEYAITQLVQQWGFIISKPSLLTAFTSAFLHGDLFHLLGNIFILWMVGTVLESGIGSLMFLLLYLSGIFVAIILYGIIGRVFLPDSLGIPLVGASGAISGVTGLAAFRYYRLRVLTIPIINLPSIAVLPLPFLIWLPFWAYALMFAGRELLAGLQDIQSAQSSVAAHWAHIGGLALGVLMAVLTRVTEEGQREYALEDTSKAAAGEASKERTLHDVTALVQKNPHDPELVEAQAGLTLASGNAEESRALYLRATRLFLASGLRERAAVCYRNILHAAPPVVLNPREQVAVASTLESLGHFPDAAQAFALVTEKYATRDEAQTALLRAAAIHLRYLHDADTAVLLLHTLIDRYPQSPFINVAHERLREAQRGRRA